MTVYRRRAASSPLALRRSLGRRLAGLERVIRREHFTDWFNPEAEQLDGRDLADAGMEDERIDSALPRSAKAAQAEKGEVEKLLARLEALGPTDSKLAEFSSALEAVMRDGRSALVFTEYADTMEYLRDRLFPTFGARLGCFSGDGGQFRHGDGWRTVSKAEITRRLDQGELHVLVCTDAASEGLNLQAASALVNYDLPWNPSKVEQRIGRIDRIGQKAPLLPIRNLFLVDSVDMRVYEALRERCGLFEHFVGPMQPVLALAREALRSNVRGAKAAALVEEIRAKAESARRDGVVVSTFAESAAGAPPEGEPSATRENLRTALDWLADADSRLRVRRAKAEGRWRITGLQRRAVEVALDAEALERHPEALALTLDSPLVERVARSFPVPSRAPLVLEEQAAGPYRCVEARWVGGRTLRVRGDSVTEVRSAEHLRALLENWEGTAASPTLVLQARKAAQAAAKRRLSQMTRAHEAQIENGLQAQVESARLRLLRELGRTLRCLGSGDLGALFAQQVSRERQPDGRYHRALERLGGYPTWSDDLRKDADAFVAAMTPKDRQARVALPTPLDAALEDPRWRAVKTAPEAQPSR